MEEPSPRASGRARERPAAGSCGAGCTCIAQRWKLQRLLECVVGRCARRYHNHFSAVAEAGRADAANACFKRFLTIALRYELVDRAELAPIEDLAQSLLAPRRTVDAKALAGEEG